MYIGLIAVALIVMFKEGGVALVNYTLYFPQNSTVVNVTLPINPIPDTLEAINDSTGSLIPMILYSRSIVSLFLFGGGYVSLVYYGNYTFNSSNATYSISINSPIDIELIIPPYIIPLNLPLTIVSYSMLSNNTLIVVLKPGNYTISYIYVPRIAVKPPITSTTTTTTTTVTTTSSTSTTTTSTTSTAIISASTSTTSKSTTTTTTTTSTISTSSSSTTRTKTTATIIPPGITSTYIYLIAIIVIVVAALSYMLIVHRRPSGVEAMGMYTLDEVDRVIVNTLKRYGGVLYQSQLQQLTGIPKTTLWRHVMKLADMGIVRIDKVDGLNRVTLIKDV